MNTRQRVLEYIATWEGRGYPNGIPDEVPDELMRERLAPSYKAICFAILNNDMSLEALGFTAPVSSWYSTLKAIEIAQRNKGQWRQLRLPLW